MMRGLKFKLRTKLGYALVLSTAPVLLGLYLLDAHSRRAAAQQALSDFTFQFMLGHERRELQRCQIDPENYHRQRVPDDRGRAYNWPSPLAERVDYARAQGKTPILFPLDDRLEAYTPPKFEVDAAARRRLQTHDAAALSTSLFASDLAVVLRMPGNAGPCAYILAEGSTARGWIGAVLPAGEWWLLPVAWLAMVLTWAAGVTVRRIRTLAGELQASAADGFRPRVQVDADDELGALAHTFNSALDEVQSLVRQRERQQRALRTFVSHTGHDLRIPLTVLLGHLDGLRRSAQRSRLPELRGQLAAAIDESQYIASLIENLTVAATLAGGVDKLNLAQFDLPNLARRVIARHRALADEKGLSLEYAFRQSSATCVADPTLLEQALSNLVYNALRHHRPPGHVVVMLEVDDHNFELVVEDDGPGLSSQQLARFRSEHFVDEESRTRDAHGQGLRIVARVCRIHGYNLQFLASKHGGLCVRIEGPRQAAERKHFARS